MMFKSLFVQPCKISNNHYKFKMDSKSNQTLIYHEDFTTNKPYKDNWKSMLLKNNCVPELQAILDLPTGNQSTSIIMNICDAFELSSEIKFAAIDNYELFFTKQFIFLREKFLNVHYIPRDKVWLAIYEIIKRDVLLQIISVIQIVTKQIDKNLIIQLEKIQAIMPKLNGTFSKSEMFKSEFLVFQMMDFQVITCVSYDTIEFLVKNCLTVFTSSTAQFRKTCMLVLEHAYLMRDIIYHQNRFKKADQVLFGAAVVVATATRFKFPIMELNQLVKLICENIPNTEQDLECLAMLILESGLVDVQCT